VAPRSLLTLRAPRSQHLWIAGYRGSRLSFWDFRSSSGACLAIATLLSPEMPSFLGPRGLSPPSQAWFECSGRMASSRWCRGSSCPPLGSKLAFEPPCEAIGLQRFASPVERVGGDLRETPPRSCAVGACAQLNDRTVMEDVEVLASTQPGPLNPGPPESAPKRPTQHEDQRAVQLSES
jgi:hypothetical protein